MLELGVLTIRRPMNGLEYNNRRREKRGSSLRARGAAPLQPPEVLSFSLNILRGIFGVTIVSYFASQNQGDSNRVEPCEESYRVKGSMETVQRMLRASLNIV